MADPSAWRWIARTLRFGHGGGPKPEEDPEIVRVAEHIVASALLQPRSWSDRTQDRYGYDRTHRLPADQSEDDGA